MLRAVQYITSRLQEHLPRNTPSAAIKRIAGVYGVVCTGVLCYSIYNLYKAYQASVFPALLLSDEMRCLKCKALLAEASGKSREEAAPFLAQFDTLFSSISNCPLYADVKETLLLKLAQYHVQMNPEKAYQLAQGLSDFQRVLKVVQAIHKEHPAFDKTKLGDLLHKANVAITVKTEHLVLPIDEKIWWQISNWLDVAKTACAVQCAEQAQAALANAEELLEKEQPHSRVARRCLIAEHYHTIGDAGKTKTIIQQAKQEWEKLENTASLVDKIDTELMFASTFSSIEYLASRTHSLNNVTTLLGNDTSSETIHMIYPFIKLLVSMQRAGKPSALNISGWANTLTARALHSLPLKTLPEDQQLGALLSLIPIYHEKLVDNPTMLTLLRERVAPVIDALPEESEKNLRIKIAHYEESPEKVKPLLQQLETLYDSYPVETAHDAINKNNCGRFILATYTKIGLTDASAAFFPKYQASFNDKDTWTTVYKLTCAAHEKELFDPLTLEQRQALAQAAENLLPQITRPVYRRHATELVLEAYLTVKSPRAHQLIAEQEQLVAAQEMKTRLAYGIALPILLGLPHVYPRAGGWITLGAIAARIATL